MVFFNIKHPLISKSISSFTSFALGDILSQIIEQRKNKEKGSKKLNYKRALTFGMTGLSMTPIYHLQYSVIERKLFRGKAPLKQFIFDQIICVPIQNCILSLMISFWKGRNLKETMDNLKKCYYPALISGYKFWPIVTYVNFKFVPHKYCEHFFNFVGVFYSAYLSYISK